MHTLSSTTLIHGIGSTANFQVAVLAALLNLPHHYHKEFIVRRLQKNKQIGAVQMYKLYVKKSAKFDDLTRYEDDEKGVLQHTKLSPGTGRLLSKLTVG